MLTLVCTLLLKSSSDIHSFTKYLLNIYNVLNTVLGTRDAVVSKIDKIPILGNTISGGNQGYEIK